MLFSLDVGCAGPVKGVALGDTRTPATTFSSVRVEGPTHVFVTVGQPQAVQVNCDESSVPQRIRTRVEADTLVIVSAWEGLKLWPLRACTVNVALPQLVGIFARGSGDFAVGGYAEGLTSISNTGSGDVSVRAIRTTKLELEAAGSGNVIIGTLDAGDVADVQENGSGDLKLYASQRASVQSTGSGDVTVLGHPADKRAQRGGSGDVRWE